MMTSEKVLDNAKKIVVELTELIEHLEEEAPVPGEVKPEPELAPLLEYKLIIREYIDRIIVVKARCLETAIEASDNELCWLHDSHPHVDPKKLSVLSIQDIVPPSDDPPSSEGEDGELA